MREKRVAFVTGASRGIGKAIVETLVNANYIVAAGYHKTEVLFDSTLGNSNNLFPVHIDVTSEQSVKQAIAYIERKVGIIDILINNAGIAQPKNFLDITDANWADMLSVNLMGAVRCSREVIPGMIEKKNGRIINISSIGGQWGGFHQVHYAAAKAGLINFTKSIARIYSGQGVTSNAVAPGLIETEMILEEMKDKPINALLGGIPIARLGSVQEVAAVVLFLSSLESSYVTGQTMNVNGGMYFG